MNGKIFFSDHGKERLLSRLKCSKHKIEKIVKKALSSKCDNLHSRLRYLLKKKGEENSFYRYYLGYIFVFAYIEKGILFVTLYNPKVPGDRGKTYYYE